MELTIMPVDGVSFSIARHAAWAPGVNTEAAWAAWCEAPFRIEAGAEPRVAQMAPMLRRRAGVLGKMALEVAYQCLDGRTEVPTVFCSRHGEVARAVALLSDLAAGLPLSPTGFGLAVHNASAGLLSIARADRANHIALAAGASSVEHAVIEACALLDDGAPSVLLVAYDAGLPPPLTEFEDCAEQPYAWAWLMAPAVEAPIKLAWRADAGAAEPDLQAMPGGLEVLRFQLSGAQRMERVAERRRWSWTRDV
jgi:hypothetical protein